MSPFVRTAGIPSQTHFRVKKNVSLFSELSKVRGLGLLIKKITFGSKNLPVEGTEGAYCGIQISARNSFLKQRIVDENDKIILEIWNGNL